MALTRRPVVVLLQTVLPDYREPVVAGLDEKLDARVLVLSGESGFEPSVRFSHPGVDTALLPNVFLLGRRLLWQRGCVRRAITAEVIVAEMNPRVITTWLIFALRRVLARPTLAWGHMWPRSGSAARTARIRDVMRSLASDLVAYTETEAAALQRRYPRKPVHAAPNGLYPEKHAIAQTDERLGRDVIYVGRLTASKKPALLLDAFAEAVPALRPDARLVLVGTGELLPSLEEDARRLGIADRVVFKGHVSDFQALRSEYWNALVSASPGYVGLSLVQSHWFGVPMIIAREEPHAPEIEAAVEGENALFVASDSSDELARAIVRVFEARSTWLERGPSIAARCVERYALEATVRSMAAAIEAHLP